MKRWKIWVGLVLIFAAGAACGGAATGLYVRYRLHSLIAGGPMAVQKVLIERLTSLLDLDEEQARLAAPIIAGTHDKLLEHRYNNRAAIEAILQDGKLRLQPLLTPRQRARLNEMEAMAVKRLAIIPGKEK